MVSTQNGRQHDDNSTMPRKLRVLVISMGGSRQEAIESFFASPELQEEFEPPIFSPGIASRGIRNRFEFFKACRQADLLPDREWHAILEAHESGRYKDCPEKFFECLSDVPIETEDDDLSSSSPSTAKRQRRGSTWDLKIHYSVELWRKGRGLNRGRSVFACMLAHLIALKQFTEPCGNNTGDDDDNRQFDVLLEDNVRCPLTVNGVTETAWRIRQGFQAAKEKELSGQSASHLLYFGWLGSNLNLEWVYKSHIPRQGYHRRTGGKDGPAKPTIVTFPTHLDIEQDLEAHREAPGGLPYDSEIAAMDNGDDVGNEISTSTAPSPLNHSRPGGSAPIWGAYAYWMSREAYLELLDILRHDVGSMLFKHKRARCYTVKPIDKVIPRQIMEAMGQEAVQLTTHPTFFRAPMLTSKIHSQYDPEFCKSTEYQLSQIDLSWSQLWLTEVEREVVDYSQRNDGKWLTPYELQKLNEENEREETA